MAPSIANQSGGAQGNAEVWLFFAPAPPTADFRRLRRDVLNTCQGAGWGLQARRMEVSGENVTIRLEDAVALYRRLHQVRVAVLVCQELGQAGPILPRRVPLQPHSSHPAWLSIRHFVMHKAFFRRLRPGHTGSHWSGSFRHWCTVTGCDGTGDPRCLPLHIFEAASGWRRRLYSSDGRLHFNRHHHADHGGRRDDADLGWKTDPTAHRNHVAAVAGQQLPTGFHWDVVNSGEPKLLHTPTGTWKIRTHVNVRPDGLVSGQEPKAKKMPT